MGDHKPDHSKTQPSDGNTKNPDHPKKPETPDSPGGSRNPTGT